MALMEIRIYNTSYSASNQDRSMFSFKQGQNLVINNLVVQEHRGSMIVINNVVNVNISDCQFTKLVTLTSSASQAQSFIDITVDDTPEGDDVFVILENFNVNV